MTGFTNIVENGTWIVPVGAPEHYNPSELDRSGVTGAITLALPAIVGGIVILIGSKWRRWSYAPLAVLWLWTVALFSFAIFAHLGKFGHFINWLGIVHVQIEWLIIGLLLGLSATQSYILATVVGTVLYAFLLGLPGIRGTYLTTSVGGGFGDLFIPILFFHGKQYILAIGATAHFVNALSTFTNFVQYIPFSAYLILQLLATTAHSLFTAVGILHLQQAKHAAIQLRDDTVSDSDSSPEEPIIPVPDRATIVRLALISLVLSLAASLPLSFGPRSH